MRNLNENDGKNHNMKKYGEMRGRSHLVDIHYSTYISKLIKISFNLINTPSTVQKPWTILNNQQCYYVKLELIEVARKQEMKGKQKKERKGKREKQDSLVQPFQD